MELEKEIVSDIIKYMKYAKYLPDEKRRESWKELVDRNKSMHVKKFKHLYDHDGDFRATLNESYKMVEELKILPSMRSMQFAGTPIELMNNRIYNCAFMPVDSFDTFSEAMFLLMGGTGVGYSVQKHNVNKLPERKSRYRELTEDTGRYSNRALDFADMIIKRESNHLVEDSIIGWAEAVKICIAMAMDGIRVDFNYDLVRPKGALLKTSGGRAPGPEPLKLCIDNIQDLIFDEVPMGSKLKPIQAHDIMCHLADAVLSGGIRRAAMISLFDKDDEEMLLAKSGDWYAEGNNPQRGRANNSVVLDRKTTTVEDFNNIWTKVKESYSGEPGFYFTNNIHLGTNPCAEISLKNHQFCNLCEIDVSDAYDSNELLKRVKYATFLGTLQAAYTDFTYLRQIWQDTTEKEALLGISMTGIGSGAVLNKDLKRMAEVVRRDNKKWAKMIGVNPAARTTCVKPAGTTSLVLGTSSGIHAWWNEHYIRTIRINKHEPIYNYLLENIPDLIEDSLETNKAEIEAVLSVPMKAPKGCILRTESAMDTLERIKKFSVQWVRNGHNYGDNTHNVSATINIRKDEWDVVRNWMWENREHYNGISVLPYDGGIYVQAPHQNCDEATYNKMVTKLKEINLTDIVEEEDYTDLKGELACAGGTCEIR